MSTPYDLNYHMRWLRACAGGFSFFKCPVSGQTLYGLKISPTEYMTDPWTTYIIKA
jgi:hypothetical protein